MVVSAAVLRTAIIKDRVVAGAAGGERDIAADYSLSVAACSTPM